MNRFILILFVCFLGLPTIAQKVYWNSPYGKVNLPLGGLKNVKDLIKKEFVFPISTILEDVIDIKYKIDKNGDIVASFTFSMCVGCGLEEKLVMFGGNIKTEKLSGLYHTHEVFFDMR